MNIPDIVKSAKTIAVVGLSNKPERYSYQVADYLQKHGYRIIPVNPNISDVLGETAYPDLLSIPQDIPIDIVDIFRRSELVLPHVAEAVKRGDTKLIWMQEGVENEEARKLAEDNGMAVVMNACLMVQHKHYET
ncbi:MAG: CoA-binding protein [Candidatus Roizmanbacteria bacterium]|nr:CoA-binding protein [Candidatus Roizmanbacteria bacterium]